MPLIGVNINGQVIVFQMTEIDIETLDKNLKTGTANLSFIENSHKAGELACYGIGPEDKLIIDPNLIYDEEEDENENQENMNQSSETDPNGIGIDSAIKSLDSTVYLNEEARNLADRELQRTVRTILDPNYKTLSPATANFTNFNDFDESSRMSTSSSTQENTQPLPAIETTKRVREQELESTTVTKKTRRKTTTMDTKKDQEEYDVKLLHLVMEREPLWNFKMNIQFRYKERLAILWKQVVAELGVTGQTVSQVQARFDSLKAIYLAGVRRIKSSGSGNTTQDMEKELEEIKHHDILGRLTDITNTRVTHTNVHEVSNEKNAMEKMETEVNVEVPEATHLKPKTVKKKVDAVKKSDIDTSIDREILKTIGKLSDNIENRSATKTESLTAQRARLLTDRLFLDLQYFPLNVLDQFEINVLQMVMKAKEQIAAEKKKLT